MGRRLAEDFVRFFSQLRDAKRVLDCLKKGVKIASQCMDPGTKAQLYVELLNKYVFFYEKGHPGINEEILQELIKRVQVRNCFIPSSDFGDFELIFRDLVMLVLQVNLLGFRETGNSLVR